MIDYARKQAFLFCVGRNHHSHTAVCARLLLGERRGGGGGEGLFDYGTFLSTPYTDTVGEVLCLCLEVKL